MTITKIQLCYWTPRNSTSDQEVARIYVNLAGERDSLGYFERATTHAGRPHGSEASYYDRHRYSKGDDTISTDHSIEWHGPQGLASTILDAVFGDEKVGMRSNWKEARETDEWGLWADLRKMSAGFKFAVCGKYSKDKATRAKARETEKKNKARNDITFNVEI